MGLLVAFTIICALLGMAKSVEFDSLYSNLGLINRIIKYVFLETAESTPAKIPDQTELNKLD